MIEELPISILMFIYILMASIIILMAINTYLLVVISRLKETVSDLRLSVYNLSASDEYDMGDEDMDDVDWKVIRSMDRGRE